MIVVGGVIPPQDYEALHAAGAAAIFPPGTVIADAAEELIAKLNARLGYASAGGGVAPRDTNNWNEDDHKRNMMAPALTTICPCLRQGREGNGALSRRDLSGSKIRRSTRDQPLHPSGKKGDMAAPWNSRSRASLHPAQRRSDVQAQRGVLVSNRDRRPGRDRPPLERDRRQWRRGERVRLVQGPMGLSLANHAARAYGRARCRRRGSQACLSTR